MDPSPFSKEQANALEKLHSKVLSKAPTPQHDPPDIYSRLFANRGNQLSAYLVNPKAGEQWIIDTGCSDHMTDSKEFLDEYQLYPKRARVRIQMGVCLQLRVLAGFRLTRGRFREDDWNC
ncbi:hypothetical protein LINPERPRIM_LOCUS32880 [Linum perenne]